uniref:TACO1/YebC-like N-terminal domain-containing protein n=1 Tax=Gallus gallus TaxID=9031 RepID=A0A8V0X3H3_CHICK
MALSAAMTVAQRSSLVAHWHRPLHRAVPNGAGHNRWSKVRHIKGQRDGQRAALIQRLCARLRAAAMDGGPDPAVNAALAQAVAQCRASNVPKASIMAAISAAKPQCSERRLLAVRGPGGSRIVVVYDGREGALLSCVKRLLHREGAALSEVPRGAFEERGWIRTAPHSAAGCPIGQEGALSAAIAAGAEDVNLDGKPGDGDGEEALEFLCPPSELSAVGQRPAAGGAPPVGLRRPFGPPPPGGAAGRREAEGGAAPEGTAPLPRGQRRRP